MTVIPDLFSKQLRVDGNTLRQLQIPAQDLALSFSDGYYATLSDGRKVILAKDRRGLGDRLALKAPAERLVDREATFDDVELTWLTSNESESPQEIRNSYVDAFSYLEADQA